MTSSFAPHCLYHHDLRCSDAKSVFLWFTLFWRKIDFVAIYTPFCGAKITPRVLHVEQKWEISWMRAVPIRPHCLLRLNKQDSWNLRNASNATAWIQLLSFKVLEPNLSLVKEERWLFPRIDFRYQSCILSMDVPTYGNCCLFVFLLWEHCKIRKMALQPTYIGFVQLLCQKTTN